MIPGIRKIITSSVRFYKRSVIYQFLIIALLSAVITGALLTGWSVKVSLKKTATARLGNTGILISSGERYFNPALAERLRDSARIDCTGLLEINGLCQNLNTQREAVNVHIFAVSGDFFRFNGIDTIGVAKGTADINEKIAAHLSLKTGDELIVRFREISDIPADAPFAPAEQESGSLVLRVGRILGAGNSGNFSLSITQIVPENIFINSSDLIRQGGEQNKMNRLLISLKDKITVAGTDDILRRILKLQDIGLSIISLKQPGGYELRSGRIFLGKSLIREVQECIPSAAPVITYLGNRFAFRNRYTPYSFVSALPSALYQGVPGDNGMIIDRWMANDLEINKGDTIEMSWFVPDSLNKLTEKKSSFRVSSIVEMKGIWADSLLMPDFPGISGSESCSDWNAGVPIKLKEIRRKDEDYWNKYRGTPKAFISYEKGVVLWGNNFGPATALRFPEDVTKKEITEMLSGNLDPEENGFTISNLYEDSLKAAGESVDFSTLFLSLGFFLILASLVLLSFAVSSYLDSKTSQIKIYFALGFKTGWIRRLLTSESGLIALPGSLIGSLAGIFASILIIKLLNTVWSGAVQTNTLGAFVGLSPVLTGFLATFGTAVVFIMFKIRIHLRNLFRERKDMHSTASVALNRLFLVFSAFASVSLFALSFIFKEQEILLCFISGSVLLFSMILLWRQYLINAGLRPPEKKLLTGRLSRLYYSFYPSHAVTPILFIATGIFAVFITGANRMNFEPSHLKPSGGTGGFLLWCDNTIPVKQDLTTLAGRESLGLNDDELGQIKFVSLKRYAGDDASCLNLNHVRIPPLLGVDPSEFIHRGSFSFAGSLKNAAFVNPWAYLGIPAKGNTIYGIADQTVLEWGLMTRIGDTLTMRSESGQKLNIVIAAGLKSSVFQGYVLIGMQNFRKYFPSVPGSSVLLVDGNRDLESKYISALRERFVNYGISVEKTGERLASFYEVTNTYLMVFGAFGALGMITGVAGLGFILLRNFTYRKREFALMMATGFTIRRIRRMILSDHMLILVAGIASGVLPALVATYPSLKSSPDIPWSYLVVMIVAIAAAGLAALYFSGRSVTAGALISTLKKE